VKDKFERQKLFMRAYDIVVFGDPASDVSILTIVMGLVTASAIAFAFRRYRSDQLSASLNNLENKPIETWWVPLEPEQILRGLLL
jgi:hypothetical protein